ncbi:hypothetical protein PR048_032843 [Dryococelus australis]|uniref:Uncharacterized protein n=1 Tax=Dryococelus australis TaxID=614101 RepID=A0ABQ9G672_9NEOP|nr:hypothetical protein PR048_032843 [Dryococelus australis]
MLDTLAESVMEESSKKHYYIGNYKTDNLLYTTKPFRLTPSSYSNEIIFNYHIPRARRVVENTLGAKCFVFRILRIPILLKQTYLLSLVVTEAYLLYIIFL